MPEQIINKIKKSVLPHWKVCFISALIMGLIAHLYKITKQAKITDGDRCQNSDNLWDWGGELAKMLEMLYILLWVVVVWVHTHELEFLWQLSGNDCRR